jgi:putative hydrolase of the HAD superfamily
VNRLPRVVGLERDPAAAGGHFPGAPRFARGGQVKRLSMVAVGYQGLLLDFGGVITSSLSGRMAEFCLAAGLAGDAFAQALTRSVEGREIAAAAEAGRVPQREFELMVARQLGLPADGLIESVISGLRPRPEVLDLAAKARAAGVATAVLSNSWGGGGFDVYTGYDLAGLFDVVVISDEVGLRKPEPEIYRLAAHKLGLSPADCVFVDDTAANLVTARELGMAGVHFTGEAAELAEVARLIGLA